MIEGVDELDVEACGHPFRNLCPLGQRQVNVPPGESANGTQAQAIIRKGRVAELSNYLIRVGKGIRDTAR